MSERILVTSALPYANNHIHLGHLVEHVQTDVYVRFRRALGDEVTWICAADVHGTPIELAAAAAASSPKEFAERFRRVQHEEFSRFGIAHDTYYTTDSPENARWAHRIYRALKAKGLIYKKAVEQLYCETDRRFLPDRYVKGTCPNCGTRDQYGDVCEKCGTTYDPRELKEPYCVLCRNPPVLRASEHAYVNLRRVEPEIRRWVEGEGHLEPAVREQVRGWLADLQDWAITRDPPYFGFPVDDPDFPGKFLYVWVDAPIGYLSSAEHYFTDEAPEPKRLSAEAFEARYLAPGAPSRLEHFIGKDILRFHAVFWPAMLRAGNLKEPDRMAVHGHLTVNGEKMSKSRGNFVTAQAYLDAGLDPQLLRYYYAALLGPGISDLDFALEEFKNRINADLANNVANLASRLFALVKRAGGRAEGAADEGLRRAVESTLSEARKAYLALEYREVVRGINELASLCNKRLQDAKPWESIDAAPSRALLYSLGKAVSVIAALLQPVLPVFAQGVASAFGQPDPRCWPKGDPFAGPPVEARERPPQIARLEAAQVSKLIAPPPADPGQRAPPAPAPSPAKSPTGQLPGVIGYEEFARTDLRVGRVLSAEKVPKADKLLKLSVDLGEPRPRTIVAGIALAFREPESLIGRRIVVVANLAPRPLRGITSEGMLLAAGEGEQLELVTVAEGIPPGTRVK